MKVIAQNGTPVNSVTPEDVVQLRKDMATLKVTPDRIENISPDVLAVLTSPDQDAIRKAAGITDEKISVQGPPGETPVIQVAGSELQTKLPSESDWRNIFDLSTLAGKDAEPAEDGKDGTGIASVDVTYQISNSGSTIPDGQWTSSAVAAPQSSYLWARVSLNLTDGTSKEAYLVSRSAIDGMPGDDGEPGASGKDGEPGKNGSPGDPGESAYMVAVKAGFSGSEADWLASLKGSDGKPGVDGKAGVDGKTGSDGQRGSIWTVGSGSPASADAIAGDMYLDVDTGDVYRME